MLAAIETELVDLKVLNGDGGRGKSDELMRHVATLFALTAEHCTDEQLYTYDTVMQRLADLVGVETRSFASQKLCTLSKAPYTIIRRFAFDTIRVAAPVLRQSPLLSDQDLIDVSDEKGQDHMAAISLRKELSSMVTDVLIGSQHSPILMQVAANGRAIISPAGMAMLKQIAANDAALSQSLAQRSKSSSRIRLVRDNELVVRDGISIQSLWAEMSASIPVSVYDLSISPYLARYDFGPSRRKIANAVKHSQLDRRMLRSYAANDQFADVVCAIAALSGLPEEIVARMMSSLDWEQTLCLFKVMSFSDQLLSELLCCGPWKLRLSRNQITAIVQQYRHLTIEVAQEKVLSWPQTGLILE